MARGLLTAKELALAKFEYQGEDLDWQSVDGHDKCRLCWRHSDPKVDRSVSECQMASDRLGCSDQDKPLRGRDRCLSFCVTA